MKIIEYTLGLPPYRRGGLPRYSLDLSLEFAKNNSVYLMYPGEMSPFSKKIKINVKKSEYPFQVIELKNMLPISLGLGIDNSKIEKFYEYRDISLIKALINKIDPDVVHLHTLMGVPIELLEYLHKEKIKIVYTTHDFYGLCPKMLLSNPIKALQEWQCSYDCMLCSPGPSYLKTVILQSHLYQMVKDKKLIKALRRSKKKQLSNEKLNVEKENLSVDNARLRYKLRKYYLSLYSLIDEFHFNSSVSQKYVKSFIPNAKGRVIPITHTGIDDNRYTRDYEYHDNLVIGYIGPYDQKKGFFIMKDLYNQLDKKIRINFYGDIIEFPFFKNKGIKNYGILPSSEMPNVYHSIDILIVPSLWHETFGFNVLESLSQGTPCLVSNTVGSKDLLPQDWIFHSISELIKKIRLLTQQEELQKMRHKVKELTIPFDMCKHSQKIKRSFYY